jgi:hypothetical protein
LIVIVTALVALAIVGAWLSHAVIARLPSESSSTNRTSFAVSPNQPPLQGLTPKEREFLSSGEHAKRTLVYYAGISKAVTSYQTTRASLVPASSDAKAIERTLRRLAEADAMLGDSLAHFPVKDVDQDVIDLARGYMRIAASQRRIDQVALNSWVRLAARADSSRVGPFVKGFLGGASGRAIAELRQIRQDLAAGDELERTFLDAYLDDSAQQELSDQITRHGLLRIALSQRYSFDVP